MCYWYSTVRCFKTETKNGVFFPSKRKYHVHRRWITVLNVAVRVKNSDPKLYLVIIKNPGILLTSCVHQFILGCSWKISLSNSIFFNLSASMPFAFLIKHRYFKNITHFKIQIIIKLFSNLLNRFYIRLKFETVRLQVILVFFKSVLI